MIKTEKVVKIVHRLLNQKKRKKNIMKLAKIIIHISNNNPLDHLSKRSLLNPNLRDKITIHTFKFKETVSYILIKIYRAKTGKDKM